VGGIRVDGPIEVRAGDELGWRSRAEMHVARAAGGATSVGWLRRGSHAVEPVSACPVLVPALQRVLEELRSGARAIPATAMRVHMAAGDSGVGVQLEDARGRPVRSTPGDEENAVVRRTIRGLDFELDARAFFQGHAALTSVLVDTALEGIEPGAGGDALDLFCGAGLFTLPLAQRFERVVGVESDARAVERARANAAANGIANARFEHGDVGAWLARARGKTSSARGGVESARGEVGTVLLDPPRRGAGAHVVDGIVALEPWEVRYVSCDPATLARDLAALVAAGYRLAHAEAFDLFPQTPHVECVAVIRRAQSS